MKKLNQFIIERLRLSKNDKHQEYKYQPKTFKDLKKIITQRAIKNKDDILDLNDIDISNIDNLSYLFENIDIKAVDMNNWDVSHVKDIHGIFWCNYNIEKIYIDEWNTRNIESFYGAFYKCKKLNVLDLSNWKFNKCKEIDLMFAECKSLDISFADNWKFNSDINYGDAFRNCENPPAWYKE